jgi:hypothetical protein
MSVEGIWKVEMMGPYGWEKVSTALLKDGRFFGASVDHYSTGSYEFADNILTADLHLNQHGKVRAVYGTKKREMDTRLEGKLKKEGKIVGKSLAAGKKQFEVKIRLTRLGDID